MTDIRSGDGWFGLALAVLNVAQTLALAYMAGWPKRRRGGDAVRRDRHRPRRRQ
jgi:hypothetical protein